MQHKIESKRDPELINKLFQELPGIVHKAIKAFSIVVKNDYQFTIPESSINCLKDYEKESNPLSFWLENCSECSNNPRDIVTNKEWFGHYNETKNLPLFRGFDLPPFASIKGFTIELMNLGIEIKSQHDLKAGNGNTRHSRGYILRSPK